MSLPTRGAWIEISTLRYQSVGIQGRSPHGERGLKCLAVVTQMYYEGRSPHGERGLKLRIRAILTVFLPVAPHTGSVD